MIKFPLCFECGQLKESDNFCCTAFPDGIPDEVLKKKMDGEINEECASGIFYIPNYGEEKKELE